MTQHSAAYSPYLSLDPTAASHLRPHHSSVGPTVDHRQLRERKVHRTECWAVEVVVKAWSLCD